MPRMIKQETWGPLRNLILLGEGTCPERQRAVDMGMLPALLPYEMALGYGGSRMREILGGFMKGFVIMEEEEHVSLAMPPVLTLVNNHKHQQPLG